MSLTFTQLTALMDRTCKTTSASYSLTDKAADLNLALDRVLGLIFNASRNWVFDDSNHTDYPILITDLVSGQRDYPFTTDNTGNAILEVYKVMVQDSNGVFQDVTPINQTDTDTPLSFRDGLNLGGVPVRYDKLSNGVFFDPVPNYSKTGGVKIYINREASYFASSDTTKKAGIAGIFHEYLSNRASYLYCSRNGLPQAGGRMRNGSFTGLLLQVMNDEDKIKEFYSKREYDVPSRMTIRKENNR